MCKYFEVVYMYGICVCVFCMLCADVVYVVSILFVFIVCLPGREISPEAFSLQNLVLECYLMVFQINCPPSLTDSLPPSLPHPHPHTNKIPLILRVSSREVLRQPPPPPSLRPPDPLHIWNSAAS